eukprot:Hpha_TRINITY_DN7545_c0_g1::TRINITY_DN7545_c0_g1_i1::g.18953::m.18953
MSAPFPTAQPPAPAPPPDGRRRASPRRPAAGASWQKSHPLEGDGLLCMLYQYLFKKNKSFLSCPNVKIPDTVVYEHNFPRAWYTYDFKNQEIQKRQGKYLDTQHIFNVFSKVDRQGGCDICAQYLFTQEQEQGQRTTSVEFLRPFELEHFLNQRKSRPDGILQKFPPPRSGAVSNTQIQVVWSPRVTLIQRRVNKHRLNDKSVAPYDRAVTYDGPAHYSTEGLCSSRTKDEILDICASIVEHFASTEHKLISRLVCYFKVSPVPAHSAGSADARDAIWLLWASSLRVGGAKVAAPTRPRLPLDLCPHFAAVEQHAGMDTAQRPSSAPHVDSAKLIKALPSLDEKQFALSGDRFFRKMCSPRRTSSRRRRRGRTAEQQPSALAQDKAFRRAFSKVVVKSPVGMEPHNKSRLHSGYEASEAEAGEGQSPWWAASREIWQKRQTFLDRQRTAQQFADDTVYLMYSHGLRREQREEGPFSCRVPRMVGEFIGAEHVPMLMGGVFGLVQRDEEDAQGEGGDRWELGETSERPHAQQSAEAARFLEELLERRFVQLRLAAQGMAPHQRVNPVTGKQDEVPTDMGRQPRPPQALPSQARIARPRREEH